MPVELNKQKAEFRVEIAQIQVEKQVKETSSNIQAVQENGALTGVVLLAMTNPMVFEVLVNILQKFIYYQCLEANYPKNVELFWNVFGPAAAMNFQATDTSNDDDL